LKQWGTGRLLALACVSVAAWLSLPVAAAETVTLYGDDGYPPYSYVENGQFKGIYVELLQAAAAKLLPHYRLELKPVPWRRGVAMLENGQALGLFPPYLRRERTYIWPYSTPLYREQVVIVCNTAALNKPRRRFPDDFGDVTIGINSGFALADSLIQARAAGKVGIDEAMGNAINIRKLRNNRIGCYINDRLSIFHTLKHMGHRPGQPMQAGELAVREVAVISGEEAFVGFSRRASAPYKDDFIRRLNAALLELQAAGTIRGIVALYSPE